MRRDYSKIKISMLIALVIAILLVSGISQLWFIKHGKSILEDYAKRSNTETNSDFTYISSNKTALVNKIDGSAETYLIAREAFEKINEQRKLNNLKALNWSNGLEVAAMIRAEEVTVKWSHLRIDGSEYWTVSPEIVFGENISKGYRTSGAAFNAWMESEAHRANILDSSYNSMAIFVYLAADGNYYWVTEFGL